MIAVLSIQSPGGPQQVRLEFAQAGDDAGLRKWKAPAKHSRPDLARDSIELAKLVWGEATETSCTFYQKLPGGTPVLDHFFFGSEALARLRRQLPAPTHHQPRSNSMKKSTAFEPLVQTHISDWLREMWEVEAQHPPMIGSRLKFGMPLPAQPKRRKAKAAKQRAVKA